MAEIQHEEFCHAAVGLLVWPGYYFSFFLARGMQSSFNPSWSLVSHLVLVRWERSCRFWDVVLHNHILCLFLLITLKQNEDGDARIIQMGRAEELPILSSHIFLHIFFLFFFCCAKWLRATARKEEAHDSSCFGKARITQHSCGWLCAPLSALTPHSLLSH